MKIVILSNWNDNDIHVGMKVMYVYKWRIDSDITIIDEAAMMILNDVIVMKWQWLMIVMTKWQVLMA